MINENEMFYIYILFDGEKTMFKVGISDEPLKRVLTFKKEMTIDININESLCYQGKKILIKNAEKGTHKTFYKYNVKHKYFFGGYTEWFYIQCFKDAMEYLEKYFDIDQNEWINIMNSSGVLSGE